jgi:hypothetical protein
VKLEGAGKRASDDLECSGLEKSAVPDAPEIEESGQKVSIKTFT